MIVYSVYDTNRTFNNACEIFPKKKWNNLLSFFYYNKNTPIEKLFAHSNNLLFDSGAFTLFKSKHHHMNFDKYFKQYLKFVEKYCNESCVKGFIELDVGKIVGYDAVKDYRKELLEVTPKILPCWHIYLGLSEYKKLISEYNYISIGGIANSEIDRKYLPGLNNYAMTHNTKIHGLGVGDENYLKSTPFYSVDTSNYIVTRYGYVFSFKNGKCDKIRVNSNYLRKNNKRIRLINFLESIKFQEYYYTYWKQRGY